jgi:hypothetical protein
MRCQAIRARPRRRRLPPDLGDRHTGAVAANILDGSCEATAPDRKWIADFTSLLVGGRLALCGCCHRPLLPTRCRLVDEVDDDCTVRHRIPLTQCRPNQVRAIRGPSGHLGLFRRAESISSPHFGRGESQGWALFFGGAPPSDSIRNARRIYVGETWAPVGDCINR